MHHSTVYRMFSWLFLAVYKWKIAGTMPEHILEPTIIRGILALACFDILGIFSIRYVRSKFYNLFLATHVVGLIVLLYAVSVFFCVHHRYVSLLPVLDSEHL